MERLQEQSGRRGFRWKYLILFSLVFVSSCNMKCCFRDCKQTNQSNSNKPPFNQNGSPNSNMDGGGPITATNNNQNNNNANKNNQPQPNPSPRKPPSFDSWLVQRFNSAVFVPALFGQNPIPEIPKNKWYELSPGYVVKTDLLGEAKLKFKDCEEVFLHFQDSRLAVSRCQSSVLGGINPVCLLQGSVDYISNCDVRVQRTIQTGNAFVVPGGTSLNITYNNKQNTTILTVFQKKADITYIIGYERNRRGEQVPLLKTETIYQGECFVNKPNTPAGQMVLGTPAMRILPNQDCAPALGPYVSVIRRTQESEGTPVTPGPRLTPDQLNFAQPPAGAASTAQEVTVTNLSLLYLRIIKKPSVIGEEFEYDATGSDCPIDERILTECKIRVIYTPRPNGTRQGTLRLETNAEGGPLEIQLRVAANTTGQPIPSVTPPTTPPTGPPNNQPGGQTPIDPQLLGTLLIDVEPSTPQTFTLQKVDKPSQTRKITYTNKGSAPIKITDVAVKGGNFLLQKREDCLGKTLKTGVPCSVEVLYKPKSEGKHSDSIVFTASVETPAGAAVAPQTIFREIALSGEAGVPLAEPSDPELCFGRWKKVKPEMPKVVRHKQTFVLTSKRGASVPVTVSDVQIKGTYKDDFSIEEDTCKGKDITDNCRITVGFSPREAKVRKATLVITHDGKDNYPSEVKLSGVGKPRNWFLRLFDRAFADKKQTCGTTECDK